MKDEPVLRFILHPSSFFSSDAVHSSALGWGGLVLSRQPIGVFARAVPGDFELSVAHVLKLDFDRIAAVNRSEPFMVSAGRNDITRVQPQKSREPRNLIGNFMRHELSAVILARLAVGP